MSETATIEARPGGNHVTKVIRNRHTGGVKGSRRIPDQLRAYRHVARHEEGKDRTGLQKVLRQQYKENPGRFLSEMTKLEASWMTSRPSRVAAGEDGPEKEDEGTERVLEHLGRVLLEYKDGEAKSGEVVKAGGTVQATGGGSGVLCAGVPGAV